MQKLSRWKDKMLASDCGKCAIFLSIISLLGSYGWWIYFNLTIINVMGCCDADNPYLSFNYETWAHVNAGTALVGPAVILIYACCAPFTHRLATP
jgi:hypothetical protein